MQTKLRCLGLEYLTILLGMCLMMLINIDLICQYISLMNLHLRLIPLCTRTHGTRGQAPMPGMALDELGL